MDFTLRIKENEKLDKYLDFVRELKNKKTMEHVADFDTDFKWCARNNPKVFEKGLEDKSQRTRGEHLDYIPI